jgi:hypothetical protein
MHGSEWYPDGGPIPPKRLAVRPERWQVGMVLAFVAWAVAATLIVWLMWVGARP